MSLGARRPAAQVVGERLEEPVSRLDSKILNRRCGSGYGRTRNVRSDRRESTNASGPTAAADRSIKAALCPSSRFVKKDPVLSDRERAATELGIFPVFLSLHRCSGTDRRSRNHPYTTSRSKEEEEEVAAKEPQIAARAGSGNREGRM